MHFRTAPSLLLTISFLAGCAAKMSDVTQVGNNTYSVSYNIGTRPDTWVEIKAKALERASQYCESLGRTLVRPKVSSNHATGLAPKEARVTFECQPRSTASPQAK